MGSEERQTNRSWLAKNLSGLSGWVVIVAVVIAAVVTVMSRGIADEEVLWHEGKTAGAHSGLESRIMEVELNQAVLSNDIGHIKTTVDDLKTAAQNNKTVLDAILIKVSN